jgi:lipid A disaccharide synthetase
MKEQAKLRIFLVAGEFSGDILGSNLMGALKLALKNDRAVEYVGIGGESMRSNGLTSVFHGEDLSVMGITELIPHLVKLWGRLNTATSEIKRLNPDIVVTIDCKGFNFRLLRALRSIFPPQNRPTFVHYVGPSIWAYRGDHTKTLNFLAQHLDHLLLLFPFEAQEYRAGPPVTVVGPPIFELDCAWAAVDASRRRICAADGPPIRPGPGAHDAAEMAARAAAAGPTAAADDDDDFSLEGPEPLRLLLLPGSRKQEVPACARCDAQYTGKGDAARM